MDLMRESRIKWDVNCGEYDYEKFEPLNFTGEGEYNDYFTYDGRKYTEDIENDWHRRSGGEDTFEILNEFRHRNVETGEYLRIDTWSAEQQEWKKRFTLEDNSFALQEDSFEITSNRGAVGFDGHRLLKERVPWVRKPLGSVSTLDMVSERL